MTNGQQLQLPDPRQLLNAPLTVLDAQAKAFSEGVTNMLNMGNASLSTLFSSLQAPLAQPIDPIKDIVLMPMKVGQALMAPLMAGVPGAPGAPPVGDVGAPVAPPDAAMAVAPPERIGPEMRPTAINIIV